MPATGWGQKTCGNKYETVEKRRDFLSVGTHGGVTYKSDWKVMDSIWPVIYIHYRNLESVLWNLFLKRNFASKYRPL